MGFAVLCFVIALVATVYGFVDLWFCGFADCGFVCFAFAVSVADCCVLCFACWLGIVAWFGFWVGVGIGG